MAQEFINVGPQPNDGLGDPIRTAFIKTNNNFSQLYSIPQSTPPVTLYGTVGDFAGMYAYDSNYFYYCFANYTNGSSEIWAQISQAANVSVTAINNGTSNVKIIGPNANATVNINGTSNIAVFATSGVYLSGVVSATGNVRGGNINTAGAVSAAGNIIGNYLFGNGSQLVGLPASYSNANVDAYLPIYSGNIGGGNISVTGQISTSGNVLTQGQVSATGDIITSGLFIGTFAGNVTGNFVVPGSNTQVIFNTNGNADAAAGMTYNKGSNTFTVLGTISSQGNTVSGNVLTGGLISATGNITGGNVLTGGLISATGSLNTASTIIATGNVRGGNLISNGLLSAAGNVIGGNIIGGNLFASGQVSAAGNVTANYVQVTNDINIGGNISASSLTGSIVSVSGNVRGGNLVTGGIITATGNIATAQYFIGDGSQLTNITAASVAASALTGSTLSSNVVNSSLTQVGTLGSLTVTANIVGGNLLTSGLISATSTITSSANIVGSNLLTSGLISAAGNITSGNVLTSGQVSAAGNITGGNLSVGTGTVSLNNIVNTGSNATGNIGSSSNYFNTVFATATTALYADLSECYLADADYAPGTVLCFDGPAEVTQCNTDMSVTVAGVVSTNPAYKMNSGLTGDHVVALALTGRVPCQVQGPVTRGAMMVSAGNGRARAEANPVMGAVIGKAVEAFNGEQGTIEIVVGRL